MFEPQHVIFSEEDKIEDPGKYDRSPRKYTSRTALKYPLNNVLNMWAKLLHLSWQDSMRMLSKFICVYLLIGTLNYVHNTTCVTSAFVLKLALAGPYKIRTEKWVWDFTFERRSLVYYIINSTKQTRSSKRVVCIDSIDWCFTIENSFCRALTYIINYFYV